jgi:hypothetical protein
MISRRVSFWALALVSQMVAGGCKAPSDQTHERLSVLESPVNEKTIIRFFYYPAGEYIRIPLLFRVVEEGNPRLNTAPMREDGRTVYVSLSEMRELVNGLIRSGLGWQESETVDVLGLYKDLTLAGIGLDTMDVRLVSLKGTAKAEISPKAICMILKPLDAALKTPRALWEFQGFRLGYGCKVPGFKYGAYADDH